MLTNCDTMGESVEKIQKMSESVENLSRIKSQDVLLDQCFFCKKQVLPKKIYLYGSKTGKNYNCCNLCRLYCYECDEIYVPIDRDLHENHDIEYSSSDESDGCGGTNEN
jgi:hypothetical protein